ncbi:erad-associated e3 ubiquitin-protein ligase component-related [Anaeramoeba flamelloides]|uniref:Erad-associated e3 ubiquitin-protein ligase component-related n=1 Tax=Anaeramoeba flamelloides TaxID=1746091 RepID=A0ABQ8ZAL3_9EUKA|nr:erad-associated e3 ubiquitin-protein ligase component-related [Anaeramoeba flamelloides]
MSIIDLDRLKHKANVLKSPKHQWRLGLVYLEGIEVKSDRSQAFKLFKSSSKNKDPDGYYYMGLCYFKGYSVDKNLKKSFKYFHESSRLGNIKAISRLGDFYFHGLSTKIDRYKALKCYNKASESGNSSGYFQSRNCFKELRFNGPITKEEHTANERALQLIKKGAKKNKPQIQNILGVLYYSGNGVEENHKKCFKWFSRAAQSRYDIAIKNLAICYYDGLGVKMNKEKGNELFFDAYNTNQHSNTIFNLASIYLSNDEKTKSKKEEKEKLAVKLLKRAVKLKNGHACQLIGGYYFSKNQPDLLMAQKYWWKGHLLEYGDCSNEIGIIYQYGEGIEINLKKSIRYYKKSNEYFSESGLSSLAYSYIQGIGCKQNFKEAINTFELGYLRENGDSTFRFALFHLEFENTFNLERFFHLTYKSAKWSSPESACNVANCYYSGIGCEKNLKKCYKWLKIAEKRGVLLASEKLNGNNQLTFLISNHENIDIIKEAIFNNKTEINTLTENGDTALHITINSKHPKYIKLIHLLINGGADIKIPNKNGETFLQLLSEREKQYILQITSYSDDWLRLLNRSEITDYKIGKEHIHKLLIETRLINQNNDIVNIEKLKNILSKYSQEELKIFLIWVYSGIIQNSNIIQKISKDINIIDFKKKKLIKEISQLYYQEDTKDFTIIIENEGKIKVHKLILFARSELFRGMFLNVKGEINQVRDYSGKSLKSIKALIKFLYFDTIPKKQINKQLKLELEDAIYYYQLNTNSNLYSIFSKKRKIPFPSKRNNNSNKCILC